MSRGLSFFTAVSVAAGVSVLSASSQSPSMPPCESAPLVSPTQPTTTPAPAAPKNLKIIGGGLDQLFDLDSELPRGPSLWPLPDLESPFEPIAQGGGVHDYYFALASRSDCFAAYSLRNAAQVEQYRRSKDKPAKVTYVYPNDPDPRRQDAMKITISPEAASLQTQLWLPLGKDSMNGHHPRNMLVTWDIWIGKEFNYQNTMINQHKGVPMFNSPNGAIWDGLHLAYDMAVPPSDPRYAYLPPGKPFVGMSYFNALTAQSLGKDTIQASASADNTWVRWLPYDQPKANQRGYSSEMVGPFDRSVVPGGQEGGIRPETWTRYWAFFERAPEHDRPSTVDPVKYPGTWYGYKVSIWMADASRAPFRVYNDLVMSPNPKAGGGFTEMRYELNISIGKAAQERIDAGRGELIMYSRNVVVLHGTQRSDVMGMLQRPVQ